MASKSSAYQALVIEHAISGAARMARLLEQNQKHSWEMDYAAGKVTFDKRVRYSCEILGSYSRDQRTLYWSWANPVARDWPATVTAAARKLQSRANEPGYNVFGLNQVPVGDYATFEVCWIASELAGPTLQPRVSGTSVVFLLVKEPTMDTRVPVHKIPGLIKTAQPEVGELIRPAASRFLVRQGFQLVESANATRGERGNEKIQVNWDPQGRAASMDCSPTG